MAYYTLPHNPSIEMACGEGKKKKSEERDLICLRYEWLGNSWECTVSGGELDPEVFIGVFTPHHASRQACVFVFVLPSVFENSSQSFLLASHINLLTPSPLSCTPLPCLPWFGLCYTCPFFSPSYHRMTQWCSSVQRPSWRSRSSCVYPVRALGTDCASWKPHLMPRYLLEQGNRVIT